MSKKLLVDKKTKVKKSNKYIEKYVPIDDSFEGYSKNELFLKNDSKEMSDKNQLMSCFVIERLLQSIDEKKQPCNINKLKNSVLTYFGVVDIDFDINQKYKETGFDNKVMDEKYKILLKILSKDKEIRYYQLFPLSNAYTQMQKCEYFQGICFLSPGLGKTKVGINLFKLHTELHRDENILWICHRKDIVESLKSQLDILGDDVVYYDSNKKPDIKNLKGKLTVILRQSLIRMYTDKTKMPEVFGIIHDECHNATSDEEKDCKKTFDCIEYIKNNNKNFRFRVGLSGTPLTGNSKQNSGMVKLYGNNGKLNFLYKMSMIDGVNGGWILPPRIIYKNVENLNMYLKNNMTQVAKLISKTLEEDRELILFRGIIWMRSIEQVNLLEKELKMTNIGKKVKIFKSTSDSNYSDDDDRFTNKETQNCVMIACDKFVLGYDAQNIEFLINFHKNKDGTTSLQQIARSQRLKSDENVKYATYYHFYDSSDVNDITESIITAILRNFEHIEIMKKISENPKKLKDVSEYPELEEIKLFLKCIKCDTFDVDYDMILEKFLERMRDKKSLFIEEINELKDWIIETHQYPTNHSGKTFKILDGEIKMAKRMEKLRRDFKKFDTKTHALCESIPGWFPSVKQDDVDKLYNENKDAKGELCDILKKFYAEFKENMFGMEKGYEYGIILKKFTDKFNVTYLDVLAERLCRKTLEGGLWGVNGNEKPRFLYYVAKVLEEQKLLEKKKVTITEKNTKVDCSSKSDDNSDDEFDCDFDENDNTIMTKVRKHQHTYKIELLNKYGTICAITGITIRKLLQACHIKPYCDCTEKEKYDINNGLVLTSDIHILFDNYLLTIDPNTLKVVTNVDYFDKNGNNINGKKLDIKLEYQTLRYLKDHYNNYIEYQKK